MFELLTDKKARLNFLNAEPMYGRNYKEAFVCSNSNGNEIIRTKVTFLPLTTFRFQFGNRKKSLKQEISN